MHINNTWIRRKPDAASDSPILRKIITSPGSSNSSSSLPSTGIVVFDLVNSSYATPVLPMIYDLSSRLGEEYPVFSLVAALSKCLTFLPKFEALRLSAMDSSNNSLPSYRRSCPTRTQPQPPSSFAEGFFSPVTSFFFS